MNTPSAQPVTKTSLAYKQAPAPAIGAQHNTAAKPFAPGANQVNGETAKSLASKLYNSPVGLYSEETIAETLSAQTEVLASGALGYLFMFKIVKVSGVCCYLRLLPFSVS